MSRSAPTNLALQLADEMGVTVVGFARGEKFNVYTHPERIAGTPF
jgi:FdhD protein